MSGRVAIIGTRGYPSYYGGFETAVRHVAPFLAEAGWDVTVYGRPGQERTDDPTIDSRITRRTTGGLESRSLSTPSYGLTAVLDTIRRRPDVALVMNCANGFWLPLLALARIPTVVNVDGIEWERAKWGRFAKTVFKAGAWLTARFADQLVFDADAIGSYWRREFRRTGAMIPYGGTEAGRLPLHPDDGHLAGRSRRTTPAWPRGSRTTGTSSSTPSDPRCRVDSRQPWSRRSVHRSIVDSCAPRSQLGTVVSPLTPGCTEPRPPVRPRRTSSS